MQIGNKPDLSSLPGVRRHERNIWQSRMLRLHNTRLHGTGLALAVRYGATGWLQRTRDIRVITIKQAGSVICGAIHELTHVGGHASLASPAFEFDLAKGPGSDCRIDVGDGWFEPLLTAALDAAWLLAKRQRRQLQDRSFHLPRLYVDVPGDHGNGVADRNGLKSPGIDRLAAATQQIHHEGKRLLPFGLTAGCHAIAMTYVDLTTVDRVQACPQKLTGRLKPAAEVR